MYIHTHTHDYMHTHAHMHARAHTHYSSSSPEWAGSDGVVVGYLHSVFSDGTKSGSGNGNYAHIQ